MLWGRGGLWRWSGARISGGVSLGVLSGGGGIFRILERVSGDSLKALGGSFLELYVGL